MGIACIIDDKGNTSSDAVCVGEVSASAVSHPVSAGDCALVRSSETPYGCVSSSIGKLTELVRQTMTWALYAL